MNENEARAMANFLVPPTWEDLSGPLANLVERESSYRSLALAFKQNILGAVAVLSMPFNMATASVHQRRFQAIHTAELIRAEAELIRAEIPVRPGDELTEEAKACAFTIASEKLSRELEASASSWGKVALAELCHALADDGMAAAAPELLRQGAVLVWGSLEVFVRDFFILLVNGRSELGRRLIESDQTRNLFQMKNVPVAVLAQYGFNLQSHLGQVLASQYDLDSVPSMKAVFKVVYPDNPELRTVLDDRSLWTLSQQRNLILHRRSVVDSQYLQATGECLPIGSKLVVSPDDVERYMKVCCELVRQLLLAVDQPGSKK